MCMFGTYLCICACVGLHLHVCFVKYIENKLVLCDIDVEEKYFRVCYMLCSFLTIGLGCDISSS